MTSSRRSFLGQCLYGAGALAGLGAGCLGPREPQRLAAEDDQFLEDLEQTTFRYFLECADGQTGLVKDRSRADGPDDRVIASIAASGFGLTALCIADERRWIRHDEARRRVTTALAFLADELPHQRGWYHHFVHARTGARQWRSEVSTIDTALLLGGVLTCRAHFQDAAIRRFATRIFDRVEWDWMLNGGETLAHGWMPESGFLRNRWSAYCEHMILYLLAMGAGQHAIRAASWDAWSRPIVEYKGTQVISDGAPLFVHQYSHAWFTFQDRRDSYANYWDNSVKATRVHRQFCADLRSEFPHYSENLWGITASDSQQGYVAWGGPPRHPAIDGSIVPCAAAGSLPFLPEECLGCLKEIRGRYGSQVWKHFGFVDAFNPHSGWANPDVIGIDAGITILMAENLRSGFVWRTFMKNEEAQRGMQQAGFVKEPSG